MNKKKDNAKNNKIELDKKTILIIVTPIVVIALIIFMIVKIKNFNKENNQEPLKIDGIDIIDKNNLLKDFNDGDIKVTNQVLYNSNNMSNYSAIITNNSNNNIRFTSIYVIFTVNNEDKRIQVLSNSSINALDKLPVIVTFDSDVSEVTNIKYEINRE